MSQRRSALLVLYALSIIALSSCSTPALPRRLYVLMPLTQMEPVSRVPGARDVTIGVGPVELPQYVNRPEIVTGHDSPVLQSAAVAEWAEPLRDGFTRVLAENLSLLLATERVAIFPWQSATPEYQVVVNVIQFLGQPGGDVALVALWSLLGRQGQEVLVSKKSSFREPTGRQDYEALAAAMSRTVAALSRDIATAISALPSRAGWRDCVGAGFRAASSASARHSPWRDCVGAGPSGPSLIDRRIYYHRGIGSAPLQHRNDSERSQYTGLP